MQPSVTEERRRPRPPAYKRAIPRGWLRVAAIVLVVGTTVGSFLPGTVKTKLGTQPYNPLSGHVGLAHRAYHFSTFGLMAAALLLLADRFRDELKAVFFAAGLGCLIEITQHVIGLSLVFEWWDVGDDCLAVLGAFVLVQVGNWRGRTEGNDIAGQHGS
jgi:hypothetical protein